MGKKDDYLLLKWGTLKGWNFENSPEAFELFKKYCDLKRSLDAATQKDTIKQKKLICEMIDKINGDIQNAWTGEIYKNKEEAKKYVMEYGEY